MLFATGYLLLVLDNEVITNGAARAKQITFN